MGSNNAGQIINLFLDCPIFFTHNTNPSIRQAGQPRQATHLCKENQAVWNQPIRLTSRRYGRQASRNGPQDKDTPHPAMPPDAQHPHAEAFELANKEAEA